MRTITEPQLESIINGIMGDREELARLRHEPFVGVSYDELSAEINKRIGYDWVLRKEQHLKFTKEDIDAVANSRFYRKSGVKLLMLLAIIILFLAIFTTTVPIIPALIDYGACAIVAIAIFYLYSKKQSEARKALWKGIEGEGIEPDKEK